MSRTKKWGSLGDRYVSVKRILDNKRPSLSTETLSDKQFCNQIISYKLITLTQSHDDRNFRPFPSEPSRWHPMFVTIMRSLISCLGMVRMRLGRDIISYVFCEYFDTLRLKVGRPGNSREGKHGDTVWLSDQVPVGHLIHRLRPGFGSRGLRTRLRESWSGVTKK